MVCPCSRAYMRGENGKESLMVCLSEYQILRTVYILVIKVVSQRDHGSPCLIFKIMSFRPTCFVHVRITVVCLAYLNRKTKCPNQIYI